MGVGPAAVGAADGVAVGPPAEGIGPGDPLGRMRKTGPLSGEAAGVRVGTGKGVAVPGLGAGVA